jgi:hypothetical protein
MQLPFPQLAHAGCDAVDLHRRQELQRERLGPGRTKLAYAGEGVVIGERQNLDAGRRGLGHELGWLEDAV